jgi:hypothetical protein
VPRPMRSRNRSERECVWIHSTDPRSPWTQNLGPRDKVAEVLSQWLASIDNGESF